MSGRVSDTQSRFFHVGAAKNGQEVISRRYMSSATGTAKISRAACGHEKTTPLVANQRAWVIIWRRVGKATCPPQFKQRRRKRAHQRNHDLDGWWARRKRAFAHPTQSFLHQRTLARFERFCRILWRDRGDQLVIIPRIFRLFRLLHFEQ